MANFTAMYQYPDNTFSLIHTEFLTPQPQDLAIVYHKTSLHEKNRTSNKLVILEVIETRPHKTDPKSLISIVKCEHQRDSIERGVVLKKNKLSPSE